MGKTGFLFTYSGPKNGSLSRKLDILINETQARVYPLPKNANDMRLKQVKVQQENEEYLRVLNSSVKNLSDFSKDLSVVENNTGTTTYNRIKGKLIFVMTVLETLIKFKNSGQLMEGRFWLPESGASYVEDALYLLSNRKEFEGFRVVPEIIKKSSKPPTRFKENELLHQYQKIVNTYGIPRYKEINPAVISSVTFPFLFGLMFGDIAHGFILFLFGLFVFVKGRSLAESFRIEHLEMRSVGILLTMMGFFAVYAGLVYNDFLALPVTIAQSCYEEKGEKYGKSEERSITLVLKSPDCQWSFSFDWAFHESSTSVTFLNSFKMKTSIIVGVVHMTLGILLKGLNCIYFRDWIKFLFVFVPELLFFLCTFGYMVLLIIVKWFSVFPSPEVAPSIISVFINLVSK